MVKILFCATWIKVTTGYAKIGYHLSNRLADAGHEVHYLAFQAKADNIDREEHPKITYWKDDEGFGDNMLKELIEEKVKPDVVLLYNDTLVGSRYINIFNKMENRTFKFVFYIDLTYKWQRYIMDHIQHGTDMFVTFHEGWEKHLLEMGVPKHKVCHLDHPTEKHFEVMDTRECKKFWDWEPDDFVILNMNRNSYRKCLDISMDGFIRFWLRNGCSPRIKMFFGCKSRNYIGAYDIQELAYTFAKINKVPADAMDTLMNKCIFMAGADHIPDENMNKLLNACDVGVNTCCGEGFGLCQTEHQMLGKPQVMTELDNFKEFFDPSWCQMLPVRARTLVSMEVDGVGGLLEFCVAEDVANAFDFYYKNPEIAKSHGQRGMQVLRERIEDW